jgi:hypothetical protein
MQYDSHIGNDLGKEYLISIIIKGGDILIAWCLKIGKGLQGLVRVYGITILESRKSG